MSVATANSIVDGSCGAYELRSETVNPLDETAVSTPKPFPIEIAYEEPAF